MQPDQTSRTRFRRVRDYVSIAVIIVVVAAGALTVWWFSDARATVLHTGSNDVAIPAQPQTVPSTLTEAWQTPSGATSMPVVVGPSVVTGDGHEVIGHDPLTGATRWSYTRDNLNLCTVGAAWGRALAVYHKESTIFRETPNCSEVTALDGSTGQREAQRNGDAELGTQLLYDGTYVTTTGKKLIDTWRSDLVQTQAYGTIVAVVNHDKQPRKDCTFLSEAVGPDVIGVIEQCPNEQFPRLTVLKPGGTDKDAEKPNVVFSVQLPAANPVLVAVTAQRTAVAFPDPSHLVVFDAAGAQVQNYPLTVPSSNIKAELASLVAPTVPASCSLFDASGNNCAQGGWTSASGSSAQMFYWFTGSSTVALSGDDLHPLWTVEGAIGPGTLFAGQLVVPTNNGIAVLDPNTGAHKADIAVNRNGYHGTVQLGCLGPMVLEQRGNTLVALR